MTDELGTTIELGVIRDRFRGGIELLRPADGLFDLSR